MAIPLYKDYYLFLSESGSFPIIGSMVGLSIGHVWNNGLTFHLAVAILLVLLMHTGAFYTWMMLMLEARRKVSDVTAAHNALVDQLNHMVENGCEVHRRDDRVVQ